MQRWSTSFRWSQNPCSNKSLCPSNFSLCWTVYWWGGSSWSECDCDCLLWAEALCTNLLQIAIESCQKVENCWNMWPLNISSFFYFSFEKLESTSKIILYILFIFSSRNILIHIYGKKMNPVTSWTKCSSGLSFWPDYMMLLSTEGSWWIISVCSLLEVQRQFCVCSLV